MSLKKEILKGTAILTAAGLVTRFLGLYNRVFLANVIGARQMGIYQLIFPVFMVCISICCSGIETALSRLVAAWSVDGCQGNVRRLVRIAVSVSMGMAAILGLGVYIFAGPVSVWILQEPECAACLRIMSPVIVFSTAHSCVLGYFYGLKRTAVPASAQLLEQVCRVGMIYVLSVTVFSGNDATAVLAVWGMLAGDGISCIYTLICYKLHVAREARRNCTTAEMRKGCTNAPASYKFRARQLMCQAAPLTANRLALTALQSVESILIPFMLNLYYHNQSEALSIFGVVTGMAMPFITFPTTITNALASMLMPTVAQAAQKDDYPLICRAASKSLHYCLLIGIVSMAVFFLYGDALGIVFFKNQLAGRFLTLFAMLCPFMYVSATLGSVLNGLGKMQLLLLHNVLSVGCRIGFVVVCVPKMGIKGYLWGMLVGALILLGLHIRQIIKCCGLTFNLWHSVILPGLAAVAGSFVSIGFYKFLLGTLAMPPLILLIIACGILAVIYVMILALFHK